MKLNKFKQLIREEIQNTLNEGFFDSDVVKELLKLTNTELPQSTFNQFGSIIFTFNKIEYVIQLMKPTEFKMKEKVSEKEIGAKNSSLKTLYTKFFYKTVKDPEDSKINPEGVNQKYNEVKYILGLNEGLGKIAKNAALGALTAASLMGSPKASAAGGHKNKIEYNQNIPAERQKEVIKAFIEFLKANHTGGNEDPTQIEILIDKGENDQVVNLFMVSEENEDTGTTQAESEVLRKNFNQIYKKFLVNNNR